MENIEKEINEMSLNVKSIKENSDQVAKENAELKGQIEKIKESSVDKDQFDQKMAEFMELQKKSFADIKPKSKKTFNEALGETIEDNIGSIQSLKPSFGEANFSMKAVGDMGITANFPAATALYQDQLGLYINPYERQWISDILPSGSSDSTQIVYPQEAGGEGGIDVWSGTGNKAQVDYDFITKTIPFSWIAGWVIVERQMLDDVKWLKSYLQSRLLIDLKTRENAFLLNDANGLLANATAYDGTLTGKIDRLIDASYGQLVEGTFDAYSPTHTILRPRDAVSIGLNKATGSGEYDLPANSIGFANGKLNVGGITNVSTTSMTADNFLSFDAKATQVITRLSPELRVFEDATLAKQNKVMFRIEERIALAVYNPKALIKGTLTA